MPALQAGGGRQGTCFGEPAFLLTIWGMVTIPLLA